MWLEIVFGLVIYKVFKRLFYDDDSDAMPDVGSKYSDINFAIADRLEKSYGGKAYVGLRIPDPDTSTKQHIDIILVTKREVMVVAVRNYSGFLEVGKDGSWICVKDGKHSETHPDPVGEITKQAAILESYLEQRGVALPKGQLIGRVILPNPNCRASFSVDNQQEVITFEKWSRLKSESKSGFYNWVKDALPIGKNDDLDVMQQRLHSILSTAPMWDRIEYKGNRFILGEFIEFKGNLEDMQALSQLKRSKVGQIAVQKATLFGAFGRSRVYLLYTHRDYRNEGSSASEWKEVAVKQSTEVVFQPFNSKKARKFKLSNIVSLTLSA